MALITVLFLITPRGFAPRTPLHTRLRGPRDPRAARVGSLARSFATVEIGFEAPLVPTTTRHAFAGANRDRQAILARWIRAVVRRVVVTERMECSIEVEIVDSGGRPLKFEITPAGIGLGAVGQIAKGYEQLAHVLLTDFDERGECQQLSFQRKGELSDTIVRASFSPRGR